MQLYQGWGPQLWCRWCQLCFVIALAYRTGGTRLRASWHAQKPTLEDEAATAATAGPAATSHLASDHRAPEGHASWAQLYADWVVLNHTVVSNLAGVRSSRVHGVQKALKATHKHNWWCLPGTSPQSTPQTMEAAHQAL